MLLIRVAYISPELIILFFIFCCRYYKRISIKKL